MGRDGTERARRPSSASALTADDVDRHIPSKRHTNTQALLVLSWRLAGNAYELMSSFMLGHSWAPVRVSVVGVDENVVSISQKTTDE